MAGRLGIGIVVVCWQSATCTHQQKVLTFMCPADMLPTNPTKTTRSTRKINSTSSKNLQPPPTVSATLNNQYGDTPPASLIPISDPQSPQHDQHPSSASESASALLPMPKSCRELLVSTSMITISSPFMSAISCRTNMFSSSVLLLALVAAAQQE